MYSLILLTCTSNILDGSTEIPSTTDDHAAAAIDGSTKIPSTPGSLNEALNALEKDHKYLLEGNVFTKENIENYLKTDAYLRDILKKPKQKKELDNAFPPGETSGLRYPISQMNKLGL